MERVFFILTWLNCCAAVNAQHFSVIEEPVCWTIGPVDSSLTRASYVSATGAGLTVYYINAAGQAVDVSAGGSFAFGVCGCCDNVPPGINAPYIDTISVSTCAFPIPPPPIGADSVCCEYIQYIEIENITNENQITTIMSSGDLPDLTVNSQGYYSNANGSINYTYIQATPTKAVVTVEMYATYSPLPGSPPVAFLCVADNGQGSITLVDCQVY